MADSTSKFDESLDIKSMKVVEIRRELEKRGLEKSGLKADLVVRLEEAILSESAVDGPLVNGEESREGAPNVEEAEAAPQSLEPAEADQGIAAAGEVEVKQTEPIESPMETDEPITSTESAEVAVASSSGDFEASHDHDAVESSVVTTESSEVPEAEQHLGTESDEVAAMDTNELPEDERVVSNEPEDSVAAVVVDDVDMSSEADSQQVSDTTETIAGTESNEVLEKADNEAVGSQESVEAVVDIVDDGNSNDKVQVDEVASSSDTPVKGSSATTDVICVDDDRVESSEVKSSDNAEADVAMDTGVVESDVAASTSEEVSLDDSVASESCKVGSSDEKVASKDVNSKVSEDSSEADVIVIDDKSDDGKLDTEVTSADVAESTEVVNAEVAESTKVASTEVEKTSEVGKTSEAGESKIVKDAAETTAKTLKGTKTTKPSINGENEKTVAKEQKSPAGKSTTPSKSSKSPSSRASKTDQSKSSDKKLSKSSSEKKDAASAADAKKSSEGKPSTGGSADKKPAASVEKKPVDLNRCLWISGLAAVTKAADLKGLFSPYGKVVGAKVVTSAKTPGAQCFGFVTMATPEEALKCIESVNKASLHDKTIGVEKAKTDPTPKKPVTKPGEKEKGKSSRSHPTTSRSSGSRSKREDKDRTKKSREEAKSADAAKSTDVIVVPDDNGTETPKDKPSSPSDKVDKSAEQEEKSSTMESQVAGEKKDGKSVEQLKKERVEKIEKENQLREERKQKEREREKELREERRKEQEKREKERRERARKEAERVRKERERQREIEKQREREREQERERFLRERKKMEEQERRDREYERQQREIERKERERLEQERIEQERIENERIEREERAKKERREREEREAQIQRERDRLEKERLARERSAREERERRERAEREERERATEREKLAERERADREKQARLESERRVDRGMTAGGMLKRPAPDRGHYPDAKRPVGSSPNNRDGFFSGPGRNEGRNSASKYIDDGVYDQTYKKKGELDRSGGDRSRAHEHNRNDRFDANRSGGDRRDNHEKRDSRNDFSPVGGDSRRVVTNDRGRTIVTRDRSPIRGSQDDTYQARDEPSHNRQEKRDWIDAPSANAPKTLSDVLGRAGLTGILGTQAEQPKSGPPVPRDAVDDRRHSGAGNRRSYERPDDRGLRAVEQDRNNSRNEEPLSNQPDRGMQDGRGMRGSAEHDRGLRGLEPERRDSRGGMVQDRRDSRGGGNLGDNRRPLIEESKQPPPANQVPRGFDLLGGVTNPRALTPLSAAIAQRGLSAVVPQPQQLVPLTDAFGRPLQPVASQAAAALQAGYAAAAHGLALHNAARQPPQVNYNQLAQTVRGLGRGVPPMQQRRY